MLLRVAAQSSVRHFRAGSLVAHVGSAQTHVLLIASGEVHLHRRNQEADTQMLVGVLEAPALFGDAELYSPGRRFCVTARAGSAVTAVLIPNWVFDRMVTEDGKIAAALYRETSARHFLTIQLMQIFALQKTQNKVLRLLWTLSREAPAGPGAPRVAPVPVVRLSRALGLHRKTIFRALKELEEAGLIERTGEDVLLHTTADLAFAGRTERFGFGASWRLPSAEPIEPASGTA